MYNYTCVYMCIYMYALYNIYIYIYIGNRACTVGLYCI